MMAVNLEAPRSSKRPPAEVLGLRDAENHERGRLESRAPASRYPKLVLATKTSDSVTPKLEGVRRHNTMSPGGATCGSQKRNPSRQDQRPHPGPIPTPKGMT